MEWSLQNPVVEAGPILYLLMVGSVRTTQGNRGGVWGWAGWGAVCRQGDCEVMQVVGRIVLNGQQMMCM